MLPSFKKEKFSQDNCKKKKKGIERKIPSQHSNDGSLFIATCLHKFIIQREKK
jgi:hypothetical protein